MNIEKLKYFIYLIEKGRTGTPAHVSSKLGVSERSVYTYVNTLKHELNAPLTYNKHLQTYYFNGPGKLNWEWVGEN